MSEEANAIGEYESKVYNTRTWEHSSPMKLTYLTALTASSTSQILKAHLLSPLAPLVTPSLSYSVALPTTVFFPPNIFFLFPPFFPQPSPPLCLLSNLAAPSSLAAPRAAHLRGPSEKQPRIIIKKLQPLGGSTERYSINSRSGKNGLWSTRISLWVPSVHGHKVL